MMRGQYTILPRLWSAERCAEARRRLDELSVSERDGRIVHATSDSPQTTEFAFTTPHLFNKGEVFEGVYQHPLVLRLVRHFLGEGATIMSLGDNAIEGRINYPGSAEGSGLGEGGLHTDGGATGAYQPPSAADGRQRIVSHVLYMQAIWCLSPFNELTGPTKIVPGALPLGSPQRNLLSLTVSAFLWMWVWVWVVQGPMLLRRCLCHRRRYRARCSCRLRREMCSCTIPRSGSARALRFPSPTLLLKPNRVF